MMLRKAYVYPWLLFVFGASFAWGGGDHTDIERRPKPPLQSLPGPLPVSKLEPSPSNECLCGPAVMGPDATPTYRALTLNDIPPGSPPGPHGVTHEYGGIDQLTVNASTPANRIYAGPASGMSSAPGFRQLVEADLPTAPQLQVLGGPTSGGSGTPIYRNVTPGDLTAAPANQFLAGPTSGGMGTPVYRQLTAADVAPIANTCPVASAGRVYYDSGSACVASTAGGSTQVYHGGSAPSFSSVSLTADVSGTLPKANGGLGQDVSTGLSNNQVAVVVAGALTIAALPAAAIPNTVVSSGSYPTSGQIPTFTVGADGRLTAAGSSTNGSALASLNASNLASGSVAKARGGFGLDVSTGLTNGHIAHVVSNAITIGAMVAADLVAHASTHLPGGSDALTTAAPVTVTGTTNSTGSAASFARSDHQHALSYGSPVATSTANADGSSNSVARADHVHALGAHASTHLPGGSDALTTAAPVQVGTANSAGSAASFARSDHVHQTLSWYKVTGWAATITTTTCHMGAPGTTCSTSVSFPLDVAARSGTVQNLQCKLIGTTTSGMNNLTITPNVNQSAGSMTCTITAGTTTCSDTMFTLSVVAGDYININIVAATGTATNANVACSVEVVN